MYFWKTKDLAKDLREKRVSEKEKMKYLLFTTIITVFAYETVAIMKIPSPEQTIIDIANLIISILVTVGGIIICYYANSRGDNQDFINRYICLLLPICIRVSILIFVLYVGTGILVGIGIGLSDLSQIEQSGEKVEIYYTNNAFVSLVFYIGYSVIIFWRLFVHINWIANSLEPQPSQKDSVSSSP